MNFEEAVEYLNELISYEKIAKYDQEKVYDIKRLKAFLEEFDLNYDKLKFIHVAGSKGKGTTVNFITNYLLKINKTVGTFVSPHIFSVKERILINGEQIADTAFSNAVMKLRGFMEKKQSFLTYFEAIFVVAIMNFHDLNLDYVVLEVGLGGRLDATNVVTPLVSGVGLVELEHAHILGDTLEKIIFEKSGVKKPGIPFIVGKQSEKGLKIFKDKFKADKLTVFLNDTKIPFLDFSEELILKFEDGSNFYFAYELIKSALKEVDEVAFLTCLKEFHLDGRFDQRIILNRNVIFDVAHTEESMKNLIHKLEFYFPKRNYVFVMALMKHKEVFRILSALKGKIKKLYFVCVDEGRGLIEDDFHDIARPLEKEIFIIKEKHKVAYFKSRQFYDGLDKEDILIFVGSFVLLEKTLPKN